MRASGDVDPLIGKRLGGRYRVVGVLGRGGMGRVYEAVGDDDVHVALKCLRGDKLDASSDAHARFAREARAAAQIESPHVVRVEDAGTDAECGVQFIAMELLRGVDLGTLLRLEGALEPVTAARIFVQAARGVAAAHARGIVHRDLKPSNLFLAGAGESAQVIVKVCDFGVAKHVGGAVDDTATLELTDTGDLLGSPVYMSPEQLQNAKEVDARSDVWSLCLSLHEALTGVRPWSDCATLGQIVLAVSTTDAARVEALAPWVDPQLARAVHRGLERHRESRYASMDELCRALIPFTAGSDQLTRDDLRAAGADRRAAVVARPGSDTDAQSPGPRRLGGAARGLVGVALAGAALVGVVALARPREATPGPAPGATSAGDTAVAQAQEPEPARAAAATGHVAPTALAMPASAGGSAASSARAPRASAASSARPTKRADPTTPAPAASARAADDVDAVESWQ